MTSLLTRLMLRSTYELLGPETEIVGLAVVHKGVAMRLYQPARDDAGPVFVWTATCDARDHGGKLDCEGGGPSPTAALDACAAIVVIQADAQRQIDEENDA